MSPYGVMLNFLRFFVLFNEVKNRHKINITLYGDNFFTLQFTKIKFKIWRVIFFIYVFRTIKKKKKMEWPSGFRAINDLPRAHWDETELSYAESWTFGLIKLIYEPRHEKTCFCHMPRTTSHRSAVHPRSLISAFVVHCLDRIIPLLAIAEISRL